MTAPHLGPGHTIADRYTITALLGFTGEVATYRVNSHQGEMVVRLFDPAIAQRADVMGELERVHNAIHQLPPSAVRVVDTGYDGGTGAPYVATELVGWPSLAQQAQQGPMAADAVSRMVTKLAEVLDAAHALGVVHRGLKATNVFVDPSGDVRVTDFNSAVIRSTSPTHEAYARAAPWWAPEQMHPSATLGPTTDVFAVGLLAFFALTGRPFWVSCQTTPPDLQAWQAEVMAARPTPSDRAAQLGVSLNPMLDSVLGSTLKVSPGERYSSVGEFARALAALTAPVDGSSPHTMALGAFDFEPGGENPAAGAVGYPPAPGAGAESAAPATTGHQDEAAAMAGGPAASDGGMTPGLPPIPVQAKKKKSPIVPVAIGVGVAVLLFGAVGGYVLFSGDDAADPTLASAEPTKDGDGDGDGDAKDEPSTADPASDPAGDGGGDGGDGQEGEGGGEADADDSPVAVTLRCKPVGCRRVTVDGKVVKLSDEDVVELEPGKHTIVVTAPGYVPKRETVQVEAGTPLDKEFELKRAIARPARPKPCGHFLNPCK